MGPHYIVHISLGLYDSIQFNATLFMKHHSLHSVTGNH